MGEIGAQHCDRLVIDVECPESRRVIVGYRMVRPISRDKVALELARCVAGRRGAHQHDVERLEPAVGERLHDGRRGRVLHRPLDARGGGQVIGEPSVELRIRAGARRGREGPSARHRRIECEHDAKAEHAAASRRAHDLRIRRRFRCRQSAERGVRAREVACDRLMHAFGHQHVGDGIQGIVHAIDLRGDRGCLRRSRRGKTGDAERVGRAARRVDEGEPVDDVPGLDRFRHAAGGVSLRRPESSGKRSRSA